MCKDGEWVDLGKRFAGAEGPEPTYGGKKTWDRKTRGQYVTRPDRVLANRMAAQMVVNL